VHEHRADARFSTLLAKPGEILLGVLGKSPRSRLCAKSCTASAPISIARSSAPLIPPEQ
jgi:hypothetical protein